MLAAHDTGANARLFPAPGAGTAPAKGQNQESARRLLHFVDRRFTFAQRVLGWNLDPETRLGRVLLLRRQAFEAERAGSSRTADFLWVEAHRALKHAAVDPAVWRHALETSAFSPAITPEVLRARFIQELFIDLHRALFDSLRALSVRPDPADRLFVHCTYVERLVDLAGFDAVRSAEILRPMFDPWIAACRDAGKWQRAIGLCARLAERFAPSGAYLDELAVCVLRMTTDRLTKPPRPFTDRDATYLQVGIHSIERVCEEHGPTSMILAALARVHAMHAVALGNTGACVEALVAISIALDYGGDDRQFRRTRDELMTAEAAKGADPTAPYRRSDRAAGIREIRSAIEAIDLWRAIGLPRPGTDWPARAHALVAALTAVIRMSPASPAAIERAWNTAIEGDSRARDVPPDAVCAFLRQRLLRDADRRTSSARPRVTAAIRSLAMASHT